MRTKGLLAAGFAALIGFGAASAGPVFLTGHDPDFHAQSTTGAKVLLKTAINFVTNNTAYVSGHKFLYVQSNNSPPSGFLDGNNGLIDIGLTPGVNYDKVDAAGLAAMSSFSGYTAIVVASSFGAMLTDAEIQQLTAMSGLIKNFVNAGGGIAALSECGIGFVNCLSNNVTATTPLFGFLPVTVSSVITTAPYTVTAYGASLGLTNADVNDPTHNSFGLIGGLNVVDTDSAGVPTTLAGNVTIGNGGFQAPEPISIALFGAGLAGAAALRRRRGKA